MVTAKQTISFKGIKEDGMLTERKLKRSMFEMPKAFSNKMTPARVVLCISGTVADGSFANSSSRNIKLQCMDDCLNTFNMPKSIFIVV